MSFFNTIQYKTIPKEEIQKYKNDEFDHSKRHVLSRVDKSFIRTINNTSKPTCEIFNSAMTTLRATKYHDPKR